MGKTFEAFQFGLTDFSSTPANYLGNSTGLWRFRIYKKIRGKLIGHHLSPSLKPSIVILSAFEAKE
jgi:hypothetical protein